MKLSLLPFLASASAFVINQPHVSHSTQLAARPDASEAIAEAMKATKKFGKTSKEARVAWDVVEELDAADNSAAYQATLDEECEWDADKVSEACMDYEAQKAELDARIRAAGGNPGMHKMQAVAASVSSDVKLSAVAPKSAPSSPILKKALADAQEAVKKHGAKSTEAKLAWENVEEIASAGNANAIGKALDVDEDCLLEQKAMEACVALEELNRAMNSNN